MRIQSAYIIDTMVSKQQLISAPHLIHITTKKLDIRPISKVSSQMNFTLPQTSGRQWFG